MAHLPPPLEIVGKIVSRHGFKGEVVIDWHIEDIELHKGDFLFIIIDEKGVPFSVKEIKGDNNIILFEYIESEDDASIILGCEIGIAGEEILIPFVEDWLVEVSENSQVIRMNLPEGLVE